MATYFKKAKYKTVKDALYKLYVLGEIRRTTRGSYTAKNKTIDFVIEGSGKRLLKAPKGSPKSHPHEPAPRQGAGGAVGHKGTKSSQGCPTWGAREWQIFSKNIVENPVNYRRLIKIFKQSKSTLKKRVNKLIEFKVVARKKKGIYVPAWRYDPVQRGQIPIEFYGDVTQSTHPYINDQHHDRHGPESKVTYGGLPSGVPYLDHTQQKTPKVPLRLHNICFKCHIIEDRTKANKLKIPWSPEKGWIHLGNGTKYRQFFFPAGVSKDVIGDASLQEFNNGTIVIRYPEIYVRGYANPEDLSNMLLIKILQVRDWIGRQYGLILSDPWPVTEEEIAAERHPTAIKNPDMEEIHTKSGRVYFVDESKGFPELEVVGPRGYAAGVKLVYHNEEMLRLEQEIKQMRATEGLLVENNKTNGRILRELLELIKRGGSGG